MALQKNAFTRQAIHAINNNEQSQSQSEVYVPFVNAVAGTFYAIIQRSRRIL